MLKKKPSAEASTAKQMDAYTYLEYDCTNTSLVCMVQYDTEIIPEEKYVYDPRIDPSLKWAEKREYTSFEVPTNSILTGEFMCEQTKYLNINSRSVSYSILRHRMFWIM